MKKWVNLKCKHIDTMFPIHIGWVHNFSRDTVANGQTACVMERLKAWLHREMA